MTAPVVPKNGLIHEIARQWRAERPDLDLQNFLLQIYLQRIGRIIEHRFSRISPRRFGMRAQDMRLLLALRRGGAPFAKRPTDLFKALLVTSGAITKQVDRLVKKKMVRRLADPDYRGGFLVQLTDRGRDAVDRAATVLANKSFIGPAMAALQPSERDAAAQFCLDLIATLEGSAEGLSGANTAGRGRRAPKPAIRRVARRAARG